MIHYLKDRLQDERVAGPTLGIEGKGLENHVAEAKVIVMYFVLLYIFG